MAAGEQAPLVKSIATTLPATGATADYDQTIDPSPVDGTLTGATFTPEAAITGANTDTRTLTIVNKGQTGVGTTVMATLAFTSGVNGVAFDEKAFTLSAVAGATAVASGDILAAVSTHSGSSGLADPGGRVEVQLSRS
jgi:hypothetical protein